LFYVERWFQWEYGDTLDNCTCWRTLKMTNYERIKSMTIEEMADALYSQEWCDNKCWGNAFMTCRRCAKEYLESEVEE
jgi:hypothetical protein